MKPFFSSAVKEVIQIVQMQMFYFHRISKEPPTTGVWVWLASWSSYPHWLATFRRDSTPRMKMVNGCFSSRNIQRNRPLRWVLPWIFTQRNDEATSSKKCSWFDIRKLSSQWEYFTWVICFTVLKDFKKQYILRFDLLSLAKLNLN